MVRRQEPNGSVTSRVGRQVASSDPFHTHKVDDERVQRAKRTEAKVSWLDIAVDYARTGCANTPVAAASWHETCSSSSAVHASVVLCPSFPEHRPRVNSAA